jgi:hypothetical protein
MADKNKKFAFLNRKKLAEAIAKSKPKARSKPVPKAKPAPKAAPKAGKRSPASGSRRPTTAGRLAEDFMSFGKRIKIPKS